MRKGTADYYTFPIIIIIIITIIIINIIIAIIYSIITTTTINTTIFITASIAFTKGVKRMIYIASTRVCQREMMLLLLLSL